LGLFYAQHRKRLARRALDLTETWPVESRRNWFPLEAVLAGLNWQLALSLVVGSIER
jgi:hypothetical protein